MDRHKLPDKFDSRYQFAAAESVYKAIVLPKILYCSTPVLMVSDTMANKFERLQRRAIKIIYNQPKSCRVWAYDHTKSKEIQGIDDNFQMLAGNFYPKFYII